MLDIDGEAQRYSATALNAPDHTLAIECDVADPNQVRQAVAHVSAAFGRIDTLVNNAGVALFKPMLETSYE